MALNCHLLCLCFVVMVLVITALEGRQMKANEKPLSDEKRLIQDLLSDYERVGTIGRPVLNQSRAVNVTFGLGLISMAVVEKDNMLMMSAWTKYKWRDEYLQWDPHDYGEVISIKLPDEKVWTPDIMLYNTASTDLLTRGASLVITHDGTVTWFPHRVFQSSCSINVRNFPFDNQTCSLHFGSWTYSSGELNLSMAFSSGIDLSTFDADFNNSCRWDILDVTADKHVIDEIYAVLRFTMTLRRKLMFSSYILTVPAIFLSFLTLVVFALPAEDVEKSQLGLGIFGSLLLLLLILVEAAPPTASAVPLLGIFYCFTTVIVILSVFLTSLVIKLGNANKYGCNRKVPGWVKTVFFRGLGRMMFKSTPSIGKSSSERCREVTNHIDCHSEKVHLVNGPDAPRANDVLTPTNHHLVAALQEQLHQIHLTLRSMSERLRTRYERIDEETEVDVEWKHLAAVLDRFFFWVYLVAIIVSIVLLFPDM